MERCIDQSGFGLRLREEAVIRLTLGPTNCLYGRKRNASVKLKLVASLFLMMFYNVTDSILLCFNSNWRILLRQYFRIMRAASPAERDELFSTASSPSWTMQSKLWLTSNKNNTRNCCLMRHTRGFQAGPSIAVGLVFILLPYKTWDELCCRALKTREALACTDHEIKPSLRQSSIASLQQHVYIDHPEKAIWECYFYHNIIEKLKIND